jgi:hypothetical protein
MGTQTDRNAGKFAEPRSWAAKWCGYGLTPRGPRPGPSESSGGKFAEPRGWSAKWCSGGLGFRRRGSGPERPTD